MQWWMALEIVWRQNRLCKVPVSAWRRTALQSQNRNAATVQCSYLKATLSFHVVHRKRKFEWVNGWLHALQAARFNIWSRCNDVTLCAQWECRRASNCHRDATWCWRHSAVTVNTRSAVSCGLRQRSAAGGCRTFGFHTKLSLYVYVWPTKASLNSNWRESPLKPFTKWKTAAVTEA